MPLRMEQVAPPQGECAKHPGAGVYKDGRCLGCKRLADKVLYWKTEIGKGKTLPANAGPELVDALRNAGVIPGSAVSGLHRRTLAAIITNTADDQLSAPDEQDPAGSDTGCQPRAPLPAASPLLGYVPRAVGGTTLADVDALRRMRDEGLSCLLYGPPGTGKTSLVRAAFPDVITITGDGDTMVGDFVGEWTSAGEAGKYVWAPGPLTTAMSRGLPLFVDDASLIPPKVIAALYPVMDGRGEISVKGHALPHQCGDGCEDPCPRAGEWELDHVTAQPGFYVIAGHNPGTNGAVISAALSSRFKMHVHVPSDYDLALALGVDERAVRTAANLMTALTEGKVQWAPQLRELLSFQDVHRAFGEDAAIMNMIGSAPEGDRTVVAERLASNFGKRAPGALALGGSLT